MRTVRALFTRRVWPLQSASVLVGALHLAGVVAFSLLHVAAMGALRWAVYTVVGEHYAPLSPLANWRYELRKDIFTCAAIVAIYVGWRLVRRAAVGQVESKPSGDFVVRLADGRELAGSRRYRRPLLES